jgi:hypothetical protein
MMPPTRVAFVTTCRNRGMHLRRTLPVSMAGNPGALFVVVDYGSEDGIGDWVRAECPAAVLYRVEADRFRMAHAKNVAHRVGLKLGADVLVNLDADNFAPAGFAEYVAREMADGRGFMWACMIPGVLTRGISGRIAVTRAQFLAAGGYDERFEDWGPDDKDFNARLVRLGFEARRIEDRWLQAVKHTERMRFREYPAARSAVYEEAEIAVGPAVVNGGRIGVCDGMAPMPSRVFGIGLHKTGTTSLAAALNMLGFPCTHWRNPRWARDVWEKDALRGVYAACDLPVSLMYRELDAAYPGAKFILTLRDEEAWLRSVERHFSWETNPYRASWNHDCFTHRLHKMVYGRKSFDRGVFLETYWRHAGDVMRYFAGSDRLLVMQRHEWEPLCSWLGVERPACEYPWVDPYS